MLDGLRKKIEGKEFDLSIHFDNMEIKFPFSERTIIRLNGRFGAEHLRIGWGKKAKKSKRGRKSQ